MKLNIYAIYDEGAKAYATPFFMHNDGLAIRAFQDNVNSDDSQIAKHADQFHLFRIGEYDDQTGELKRYEPLKSLGGAIAFKNPKESVSELTELLKAVSAFRTETEVALRDLKQKISES